MCVEREGRLKSVSDGVMGGESGGETKNAGNDSDGRAWGAGLKYTVEEIMEVRRASKKSV